MKNFDEVYASLNRLEDEEIGAKEALKEAKGKVAKSRARTHLTWVRGQIRIVKKELSGKS